MTKFDLKSGYHHVDIFPEHRKYLGFSFKTVYKDISTLTCQLLGCQLPHIYFPNYCAPFVEKQGVSIPQYIWTLVLAQKKQLRKLNMQPIIFEGIVAEQKVFRTKHKLQNGLELSEIRKVEIFLQQISVSLKLHICLAMPLNFQQNLLVNQLKQWDSLFVLVFTCKLST